MFPDQFSRVEEAMGAADHMIFLVASDDCGHALFAHTRISHHNDPAWFCSRANWRAIFHVYAGLTNRPGLWQAFNLRFLRKYFDDIARRDSTNQPQLFYFPDRIR
jgi:hypothetical protein